MLNPIKAVLIVSGLGLGLLSGRGREDRQSLGAGISQKHFIYRHMTRPAQLGGGTLRGTKPHFFSSTGVTCLCWWERGEEKQHLFLCKITLFA